MTTKLCPMCKLDLPLSSYQKAMGRKNNVQAYCRQCTNQKNREHYSSDPKAIEKRRKREARRLEKDPMVKRRAELLRVYGITLEEWYEIYDSQNGVCAICKQECKTRKSLSVDHDHETGDIRGLLCNRCNRGLGLFRDDPEVLKNATRYLQSNKVFMV